MPLKSESLAQGVMVEPYTHLVFFFMSSAVAAAQMSEKVARPPPAQIEQTSYGIRATAGSEVLEVTVCADSVIHVVVTAPSAPASPRSWMFDSQQACLERHSRLLRTRKRPV